MTKQLAEDELRDDRARVCSVVRDCISVCVCVCVLCCTPPNTQHPKERSLAVPKDASPPFLLGVVVCVCVCVCVYCVCCVCVCVCVCVCYVLVVCLCSVV